MPRTHGSDGAKTSVAIREAAADLFFRRGYEATSLREVAAAVGVQVGSLYNHIKGKEELLNDIMTNVMIELETSMDVALQAAGPKALDQLSAATSCHAGLASHGALLLCAGRCGPPHAPAAQRTVPCAMPLNPK